MKIHAYTSASLVETSLSERIIDLIGDYIKRTNHCILALSGGSTPKNLYSMLGKALEKMPKDKITIIQVDERFVKSDDNRANQKLITEKLDIKIPNFLFVPMKDEVDSVEQAQSKYQKQLVKLLKDHNKSSIDICILGMGKDGHTASLFPENPDYTNQINEKDKLVIGTKEPTQPEPRISLSNYAINSSSIKFLLIYGEEKIDTLKKAIFRGSMEKYPILSVLDDLNIYTDINDELFELSEEWYLTNDL